jgi:hypothetical protein
MKRLAGVLAALVVTAGLGLGTAGLADAAPAKNGFVLLTVGATTTALPPGQAVKRAIAICGDRVEIPPTVEAVRGAFPGEVAVCEEPERVTLLSQVAPEPTPVPLPA